VGLLPELAVLHALHAALKATEQALLAAHPELEEIDLAADPPSLPTMASLAELLISQLAGLDAGLTRYCTQLQARSARWRHGDDF
jgi:hypothetical protein